MDSKLFYKAMSGFYDLIDIIYFRSYKNSPRKVVFESIGNTEKVLDLCTGTTTNALKIAKSKPLSRVIGIDLSKDMLKIAKSKVKKAQVPNIKLYDMDAANMRFKDKCFDKILLSLVLHEIEENLAEKILAEAKRVLKDDGEIIVTEWEKSDNFFRKAVFLPIKILEPKSFKTFIQKDLYSYFEQYGMKVVSEKHCDYSRVLKLKKVEC